MKGLPKNTIAWLLFCGSLAAPSAWGFETNYDRGRVDFAGRVTDISCSIALNGGQHAGSGNVWLAPVSLAEVHDRGAGAFMKPQPFTLALSNCQLRHDGGAASQDEVRRVSGGLFTYYVGYVSPTPKSATSGPITSWATWELVYN
ncbi:hypothetical protein AXX77_004770 [Escherichia coli]|nr:hypothetical protein [Escherichia coli]